MYTFRAALVQTHLDGLVMQRQAEGNSLPECLADFNSIRSLPSATLKPTRLVVYFTVNNAISDRFSDNVFSVFFGV